MDLLQFHLTPQLNPTPEPLSKSPMNNQAVNSDFDVDYQYRTDRKMDTVSSTHQNNITIDDETSSKLRKSNLPTLSEKQK